MKNKISEIIKKTDQYSVRSEEELKTITNKLIKSVFVGALKSIELKFGKEFNGHDQIKSEIFRIGNNAIRDFDQLVTNYFNVEQIPAVLYIGDSFIGKVKNEK